jgi:hypothetical protein
MKKVLLKEEHATQGEEQQQNQEQRQDGEEKKDSSAARDQLPPEIYEIMLPALQVGTLSGLSPCFFFKFPRDVIGILMIV